MNKNLVGGYGPFSPGRNGRKNVAERSAQEATASQFHFSCLTNKMTIEIKEMIKIGYKPVEPECSAEIAEPAPATINKEYSIEKAILFI